MPFKGVHKQMYYLADFVMGPPRNHYWGVEMLEGGGWCSDFCQTLEGGAPIFCQLLQFKKNIT